MSETTSVPTLPGPDLGRVAPEVATGLPVDLTWAVPRQANGYALEAFGPARWPVALQALQRGYPRSDPAWWQAGFERTQAVPNNAPGQPLGLLVHGPSSVVGVVLLYASQRPVRSGIQLHVNLSSWAMTVDSRDQAHWAARHAMLDRNTVYSSLTPIASSARILRRLGLEAISHQLVLSVTARLALARTSGMRVLDAATALGALRDDPMAEAFRDHHRLGCLFCAVETPNGLLPIVFRRRWRPFKIPVAEVVYVPSVTALAQVVGPLARFLLVRGYPLMEFEADEDMSIDFPSTRLFRRRLAAGPYPRRGIDHLYSELVYLHR